MHSGLHSPWRARTGHGHRGHSRTLGLLRLAALAFFFSFSPHGFHYAILIHLEHHLHSRGTWCSTMCPR